MIRMMERWHRANKTCLNFFVEADENVQQQDAGITGHGSCIIVVVTRGRRGKTRNTKRAPSSINAGERLTLVPCSDCDDVLPESTASVLSLTH
jgi:hypothetical protein